MAETKEPQYQRCLDLRARKGLVTLGLMSNVAWDEDPKRLTFLFSRYKFVAKMFSGMRHVLEVGCADAFATRVVRQETGALTAVDFDLVFVRDVNDRMDPRWQFECKVYDMLDGPVVVDGGFDGAYSLDVIEHIPREHARRFVANVADSLSPDGAMIVGTPSLQSQAYASPASKEGHVNCMDAPALKGLLAEFFHRVFIFSMNDEVVHTGYYPMAQYLLALCCQRRAR